MARRGFWGLVLLVMSALAAHAADVVVDPAGDDVAPGTAARPVATVARAQALVRELRGRQPGRATPVEVELRPGVYPLVAPLEFGPADGGTAASPTQWRAAPGGDVVLSGGTRLSGWTVAADRWTLQLPADQPLFSLLFVNDQPRYRPRLPQTGAYIIAEGLDPTPANRDRGGDQFRYRAGDLRPDWHNRDDVELVVFHQWNVSRMRIASLDEAESVVHFTGPTIATNYWAMPLTGHRYLVDNVREALNTPGQWYLDSRTRELTYLPLPGETPENTVVVAPRLEQVLRITGDPAADQLVRYLSFDGLTFAHTNWACPPQGNSYYQNEANLSAAVAALGLQDSDFTNCRFRDLTNHGMSLGAGCQRVNVERCVFTNLGAGGIKIGTTDVPADTRLHSGWNVVRDCTFSHGGRFHPAGPAVWIAMSPENLVEYNDICDFYQMAVSIGWTWGYDESLAYGNRIAHNRIWDIGQRLLSDMGGTYTLGRQPGTVIEHNLIHDVDAYDYGGWGIYFDEGSSDIVARDNLVYRTKTGGFHLHYGADNRFENNIVAYSRVGQLQRTRAEEHLQYTLERNIVLYDRGPLTHGNWQGEGQFQLDHNLYWNTAGEAVQPGDQSWAEWQARGQDQHSVVADPLFVDPRNGDFRLQPGSPALEVGFVPFALEGWGSREASQAWALEPLPAAWPLPPPAGVLTPIHEDFEGLRVGAKPPGWTMWGDEELAAAAIRVSDDAPAGGQRCLKFTDAPGLQNPWDPHAFLAPMVEGGRVEVSFDFKAGAGTKFTHEWRDQARRPVAVGPTISVDPDGAVRWDWHPLTTIVLDEWVHLRIIGPTGEGHDGLWSVELTHADGRVESFTDLTCAQEFRELSWLGFTSHATDTAATYIDNLVVRMAD